jgi:propanediol dehydratase small subunit
MIPIGTIAAILVEFAPPGWLAFGATYASADYPELANLLPDSVKTGSNFTLPDQEDLVLVGATNWVNTGTSDHRLEDNTSNPVVVNAGVAVPPQAGALTVNYYIYAGQ